jgi:hypothetical protein
MSDVLLTSMIEKMDAHERKIEELSAKVNGIVDYTETLDVIVNSADEIKTHLQKNIFPRKRDGYTVWIFSVGYCFIKATC